LPWLCLLPVLVLLVLLVLLLVWQSHASPPPPSPPPLRDEDRRPCMHSPAPHSLFLSPPLVSSPFPSVSLSLPFPAPPPPPQLLLQFQFYPHLPPFARKWRWWRRKQTKTSLPPQPCTWLGSLLPPPPVVLLPDECYFPTPPSVSAVVGAGVLRAQAVPKAALRTRGSGCTSEGAPLRPPLTAPTRFGLGIALGAGQQA
jgi:hypothetical protein